MCFLNEKLGFWQRDALANVGELMQYADEVIVGAGLRSGAEPGDRMVEVKVRQLM